MPKAQSRWHQLYCTTMWRKRAKHQLRSQPLCEVCLKDGRINAATIADHIEPHKGDQQKFFFGELQSLCKLHHESAKKREEARGYSTQIGADGWPVDPRHPLYSRGRGA
jgi:5-methylcytosine-specific restriction enzyme A